MGLALEVGYLADLQANDEEAAESFCANLDRLNEYLRSVGLPAHREPTDCKIFSCDMFGYSGLHYLRRIAAHLDLRGTVPPPGGEDASKDENMAQYYKLSRQQKQGFFGKLLRRSSRARTFDHLLLHSDAEGYYLPQEFASVLFPPADFEIPGGMIGSSPRLLEECKRLAAILNLPLEIDPEAEVVWQACESQGEGDVGWQRYGIESFVCLRLYAAATHSLEHGAAIVFC